MTEGGPILEAIGLTKHFAVARAPGRPFHRRYLHAVDNVDIALRPREIVALVGESGSGKSTVARLLALVYRPTSGEIRYRGQALHAMRGRRALLAYRSRVPMVLQDPYSSLHPNFPAAHGILRTLKLHRPDLGAARHQVAEKLLETVGLTPSSEFVRKYPHELSGGQRQRIGFAQALACRPDLILADEPVSMLDVSIRIGLLNLMAELRNREQVSFLYITHDIASVRYVSDRVLVMYAGQVVETGPVDEVLANPKHPYTQLLLATAAAPRHEPAGTPVRDLGEPPRVVDPGPGCRFRPRCPYAIAACASVNPPLRPMRRDHQAACLVAQPDQPDPTDSTYPTKESVRA